MVKALLGILSILIIMKTKTMKTKTVSRPRGIRNNNPLNIRYNKANDWQGQTGTDGEYAIFSEPEYGIRAAAKLLDRYVNVYGLRTVEDIINRWAPTIENNTSAYVSAVSNKINVSESDTLLWPTYAPLLIKAMIHHENGEQPYTLEQISEGVSRAGI